MTLDEASKTRQITPAKALVAQQAALMRLQLYLTGATHQVLGTFLSTMRSVLADAGGKSGTLDGYSLLTVTRAIDANWPKTMRAWETLFQAARREAASIPYGAMAVFHNAWVAPVFREERVRDPRSRLAEVTRSLDEAARSFDPVFGPQIDDLIQAADKRVYQDGLQLSARIWQLNQTSLSGIKRVIYNGVANGTSAWDMASDLEAFLGIGGDCPRWTRTRLMSLTKKDIASGDRTGLLSGEDCDGRGVAYKALRLARNELQVIHHMATDALMQKSPWIEKEKIELSPDHPEEDICDDVVSGGENGDGVYPKGEISLPLHVQCLCFKTAVLPDADEFAKALSGWMQGEANPGMDTYTQSIGGLGFLGAVMGGVIVGAMAAWLWDDIDALADRLDD